MGCLMNVNLSGHAAFTAVKISDVKLGRVTINCVLTGKK